LLSLEIRRRDEQDRFMSMLSHELKTPLSVVSMTLGLSKPPSASVQAHAQEAVRDIQAVVDRCLQVDRLRHRRGPKPQLIDLPHLLVECRNDCAQPERMQIDAPDIPALTADELSLRTIVANLMDNALKYAASGSLVQVKVWPLAKRGQPGVMLQVRNTVGPAGQPDPRRLFQKYYRSPGAHRMTGSGLGLYLVRGLLKGMGGRIDYRAQENACIFELWLPLANP
jgi:signal transduction histidine kinase